MVLQGLVHKIGSLNFLKHVLHKIECSLIPVALTLNTKKAPTENINNIPTGSLQPHLAD